ncbi:hypothetical protein RR46_05739 [Papilio xuthus]|uniref:Uncharacterized protein n=1 Tax=Papilio xuthus TaxID=66420 RepID=A0A194PME0_PAPXU|nr:hypothetical protein RR46_05739 [Papilio xuthus]
MQTRLIDEPASTWYSSAPRMNASGTSTRKSTRRDSVPPPPLATYLTETLIQLLTSVMLCPRR